MDPFAEFDRDERQTKRNPPAVLKPIGRTAEETFREFTETGAAADSWEELRQDNAPDRGTGTGQAHRNRMLRVMARRAADSRARFAPNRTWVAPTARRMPSRPLPTIRSSRAPLPPPPSRAPPPRAPAITRSQTRPAPTAPSRPTTSTSGPLPPRPSRSRHSHPMPSAGAATLCNQPYWDTAAMQRNQAAEALRNATNQPASLKRPSGEQPSKKAAPSSPAPKLSNEPFWLQKTSTAPKSPPTTAPEAPAAATTKAPISQPAQAKATSQIVSKPAVPAATKNNVPAKASAAMVPAIATPKTTAPANTVTGNTSVAQSKIKMSNGPLHAQTAPFKALVVEQKSVATNQAAAASGIASKASLQPVQMSSTVQPAVVTPTVRPAPGLPPPGLSAPRENGAAANNIAGPSKHTERLPNGAGPPSVEVADRVSRLEAGLRELKVGDTPTSQRKVIHKEATAVKSRDSGESMHAPPKTTTMNENDGPEVKTSFRLRVRIRRLERTQPMTIHPGEDLKYRAESFCRVWQLDGYEERLYEALKQACILQAEEVNKRVESGRREADLMRKSGRNGRL